MQGRARIKEMNKPGRSCALYDGYMVDLLRATIYSKQFYNKLEIDLNVEAGEIKITVCTQCFISS